MTFEGTDEINVYKNVNLTYEENGQQKYQLFKFFGKSMYVESNSKPIKSRSADKYNLLVFIIMDVDISQDLLINSTAEYLDKVEQDIAYVIMMLCLILTLIMGVLIYILIHCWVLRPIIELSSKMTKHQDLSEMQKFVQKIQKAAELQQKEPGTDAVIRLAQTHTKQQMKKIHAKLKNEVFFEEEEEDNTRNYIDEVEQLRVLFSQFFLEYSKDIEKKEIDSKIKKMKQGDKA